MISKQIGIWTRVAMILSAGVTCALAQTLEKAIAVEGLMTLKSAYGVTETVQRLNQAIANRGLKVFAQIDHAAGAATVGMPLRPTYLVIFGNASGGTPVMQSVQTAGIDLPLKALVWQDEAGATWLSYGTADWIAVRHHAEAKAAISAMTSSLATIVAAATTVSGH